MKKKTSLYAAVILLIFLCSGCITLHLGKRLPQDKLKESVVEGKGWNKILIIDITGLISDVPARTPYAPPVTLLQDVKEKLKKAEKDRRIKGVILRINSPGGTVTASDTIFEEIRRFKKEKKVPVVAQMIDTAASGGYYVSVSADRIIAQPTSITGSIGVILQKFNLHELLDKIGIANTPVKSGALKDIGSPFRPQTEEEKRILQETIDALYNRFVDTVAENRKELSREAVLALADGRIYTADEALKKHLIDRIGYMEDAIEEVKEMAGLEKAKVVLYRLPYTYKENIYSAMPPAPVTEIHLLSLTQPLPWTASPFLYLWDPR
jgi:protease-4